MLVFFLDIDNLTCLNMEALNLVLLYLDLVTKIFLLTTIPHFFHFLLIKSWENSYKIHRDPRRHPVPCFEEPFVICCYSKEGKRKEISLRLRVVF